MERNGRIAYETIRAAKRGDPEAVQEILRHYERYILRFCGRTVYDEEGVPHKVIDENRRKQIEAEYVAALILRYDADRRPGEAPERSTAWVILGLPVTGMAVPLWMTTRSVPSESR